MDSGSIDSRSPERPIAQYTSRHQWSVARPAALVIACSDGRLQKNLDDFLQNHLGISDYDRLYLPGGPGGLAGGGAEYLRAAQLASECTFLVKSHGTDEVILIFHGATADGPDEAICADYRRKHHTDPVLVAAEQEKDLRELMRTAFGWPDAPRVRAYRADVGPDGRVGFFAMSVKT